MEAYKHLTNTQTDDIEFAKLNRLEALNYTLILELERISLNLKATNIGSSHPIERLIVATKAPSLNLGEISDKGALNPKAILNFRSDLVADLYEDEPFEHMIIGGQA